MVGRLTVASPNLRMTILTNHPERGMVRVTWRVLNFGASLISLGWVKIGSCSWNVMLSCVPADPLVVHYCDFIGGGQYYWKSHLDVPQL